MTQNHKRKLLNKTAENIICLFKEVRASSLKRFRLVPLGMENWRINDDKMSIADIAYHLLESDNWTIQKIKNPGLKSMVASANIVNIVSREEYDDILNRLEKILGEKILAVKNFTLWDFDKMIYDDRFGKEVNLWFMIMRGNIDHEIHHRGQLSAYLQLIG